MADRESEESEEPQGKLIPARPGSQASFVQRLRRRFGRDVDPEISLQEDESSAWKEASESEGLLLKLSEKDPAARRYRIKGELARGGMGAILRVWDDDLRRNLAMKVLLSRGSAEAEPKIDPELLSRFLEEAQITGQLDHPGIVPVHDLGIDANGRVYFTMRLVRGRDLKQILDLLAAGEEGWSVTKALHVILKVCEAMGFAHSKGVVHRDLKPANIMVGRFGETYVMDWGLARVLGRRDSHDLRLQPADASALSLVRTARKADQGSDPKSPLVTMDGDVIGTPSYMAPEQAEGRLDEVGPRSDVYALGAILYQLLCGEAPYVRAGTQMTPQTVLLRALEGPPAPIDKIRPGLPSELVAICEKAMQRAPAERYGSMPELAADIEAFLEGRVVTAYEAGPLAEARKWMQRNRGMAAALAAALLLFVGGIAGVISVQVTKARQLKTANADLAVAIRRATDKERDANTASQAARDAAREATQARELATQRESEAMENERTARMRGYISNIRAVEYSLRLRAPGEAAALLERCDEDLRDFEWRHLALRHQGQLGQPINLTTPTARVRLTPDGRHVIVLTGNGQLHVFEPTGLGLAPNRMLRGDAWATLRRGAGDFDISQDGEVLAVVGRRSDAVVLLSAEVLRGGDGSKAEPFAPYELDPGDGGLLPPPDAPVAQVAGEPSARVTTAAFGPRDLLAVGYDNGVVLLWDWVARELVCSYATQGGAVRTLAWQPRGEALAVGGSDGVARFFEPTGTEPLRTLGAHEGAVLALSFSPDGELCATGADDGRVRLWSSATGELIARHDGHQGPVHGVAFDPGGSLVVSGGEDATLQVWDVEPLTLPAEERSGAALDVRTLFGHELAIETLAFLGTGALLLTGSQDGSLRAWDPLAGGHVTELIDRRFTEHGRDLTLAHVRVADFHPDGVLCLTGHSDGSIAIWDSWSGELYDVLRGHQHAVHSATWSADGQSILSASVDKTAILWDVAARRQRKVFKPHRSWVRAALLSPDQSFVVTASGDQLARVFDASSGELELELGGHRSWVNALAITPDQLAIWTGSRDGTLLRFTRATGAEELQVRLETEIWHIALSPDGTRLAAGLSDGRLVMLDAKSGAEIFVRQVTPGEEPVSALEFHPSGSRLVVGGMDGWLRIYSPTSGDQVLALEGHTGGISGASFNRDGTRLLTTADASTELQGEAVSFGQHVALVWETGSTLERRESWRRAVELRARALPTVAALYSNYFLQERVLVRLEQMTVLPADVRLAAQRLARLRPDDPRRLAEESLDVVLRSSATAPELALAQSRAEAALTLDSASRLAWIALGGAQVRRGLFDQALLALATAEEQKSAEKREDVALLCFLAQAHASLGHADDAGGCLERLDALLAKSAQGDHAQQLAALVSETRQALAALAAPLPAGG